MFTVAERICGAIDRVDPPGLPWPRRRIRGAAPASCAVLLPRLLQPGPHAPISW